MGCGNPNPLDPCTRSFMQCDNPCKPEPGTCPELLPTQIDTFVTQFFGTVGKSNVGGSVAWSLPCGLDAGIASNPRLPGESLACYFLRLFEAGLTGHKGLPGMPGADGLPGPDAFSFTRQDFDQPSLSDPYINIAVNPSASLVQGLFYEIEGSGFYQLQNINPDGSALFVLVQPIPGAPAIVPANALVVASGMPGIRVQGLKGEQGDTGAQGPNGIMGLQGQTITTAPFVTPSIQSFEYPFTVTGSQVTVQTIFNPRFVPGSYVYVPMSGWYQVVSNVSSGQMVLQLLWAWPGPGPLFPYGNGPIATGSTVPAGTDVFSAGNPGSQGKDGDSGSGPGGNQVPTSFFTYQLPNTYMDWNTGPGFGPKFSPPNKNAHTYFVMFSLNVFVGQIFSPSGVTGSIWSKIKKYVNGVYVSDVQASEREVHYSGRVPTGVGGATNTMQHIAFIDSVNQGDTVLWVPASKSDITGNYGGFITQPYSTVSWIQLT